MTASLYNVGGVELPRPFRLRRLGHFGLFHKNLDAARKFYIDQLGLRLTDLMQFMPDAPPAGFFASYGTDHHSFACIDAMLAEGQDDYESGVTVNQISFQVGSLEEVVNAHRYFTEHGVHIWRVGRDFPGSNWTFYCRDPDGFLVEIFYGIEQIGWNLRSKPEGLREVVGEPPTLPQPSERTEISTGERNGVCLSDGFHPPEPESNEFNVGGVMLPRPFKINRTGPLHLFVSDVARSEAFYTDMVGLQKTEEVTWEGHRCVFLRVNADHHVIGLYPIALRERLGFSNKTTLMSAGVDMCSYQQLKDAVAHLRAAGIPSGPTIPHELLPGIDHCASFLDPEGHNCLLYFSMEQVGWDGRPRPASERRPPATGEWPATIAALSDTYASQTLQGPVG